MAKNGKSLEEIMQKISEMQQNEGKKKKKLPDEQIRLFVSEELKGTGKADPNSETAKYLGNLLAHNPSIKQELKNDLPAAQQARKKKMKELRDAAAIQGEKKRKLDLLARKKRAAQRELQKIAQAKRRAAGQEELKKEAAKTPDTGRGKTPLLTALVHRIALGTHAERHANVPFDQKFAYKPVEHKTGSGVLRGAEFEPIGKPNGKVVLFFSGSGGPAAQYVQPVLEPYLLMGAKVVAMDYRGFGKSETLDKNGRKTGTPLSEKTMYQDGKDMLEYVTKTMGVKPENVILHGYSMGGPVASKVAADFAQEPERVALTEGRKVKPKPAKLGGVVLHSPTNTMYEVAKETSNTVLAFGGWAFGGGFNTASHMKRLHQFDPEMPVHYVSGNYDSADRRTRSPRYPGDLREKLNDAYEDGLVYQANRRAKMSEKEIQLEDKALRDAAKYMEEQDQYDGLDIEHTKIHRDPEAQFVNATSYRGTGAHMSDNLSYNDQGLRRLMETNRSAEPGPQREQEPQLQGPWEQPDRQ